MNDAKQKIKLPELNESKNEKMLLMKIFNYV